MTKEEFDVKMGEFEKILQQTAGDLARGTILSGKLASEPVPSESTKEKKQLSLSNFKVEHKLRSPRKHDNGRRDGQA
jgi:hypothetical protein